MRKFVLGLLVGIFIMTAVPLTAAIEEFICYKADYKLVVNGVEYQDEEIPLLNYKGYTVGSVKKILEAVGMEVVWNAELGQAEVRKKVNITPAIQQRQPKVEKTEEEKLIEQAESEYATIYVKSNIIDVNSGAKYRFFIRQGDYYLEAEVFSKYKGEYVPNDYELFRDKCFKLTVNGKEVKFNRYRWHMHQELYYLKIHSTQNVEPKYSYEEVPYFNLKAFGLKGKLEGNTLYIE